MSAIGPEGRRLLEDFRAEHSPPADAVERGLEALPGRLAAPDPSLDPSFDPEPDVTPSVPPATAGWLLQSAAITVVLAAAGLGAVYLGTTLALRRARQEAPTQALAVPEATAGEVAQERAPRRIAPAPEPAVAPGPEPIPAVVEEPVVTPRPRAPATPRFDALEAEVRLIGQAKAERDPKRVLKLLDQHARKFPGGALREEASLLRADAMCRAGRVADARRIVDAFLREHPGSSLGPRMASICAREGEGQR